AKTLKVNAGHEPGTDVGPVVSAAAKARILGLIESGAKDDGATLLLDGRGVAVPGYEQGNFVGPTIFSNVTTDMSIYQQEIFGPVIVVLEADTLDDAIALVNRNPMGNGVGLFTQSGAAARKFQSEIDVGQTKTVTARWFDDAPSTGGGVMEIAFIGLGNMGRPMALNLLRAGHALSVFDLDPHALDALVAAGARRAESPRAAAADAQMVVTMLPAAAHVRSVYLDERGVLAGVRPDVPLIDSSTIDPATVQAVAAAA
ncbi:hypothetical protein DFQ30_004998, partial [Apophysomyces sp. BC1015]